MEVMVFVGIQGSGKSTFYRDRFAGTHVHVSMDNFRNARRPRLKQMTLIEESLLQGLSVVVDNTDPTVEDRAPIIAMAKAHGATVTAYHFDSPLADCLERNGRRTGRANVPKVAILATIGRLKPPTRDEGFDRITVVRLVRTGEGIFEYLEESVP
ncbi:ATP-binding protein [Aquisphaera insulae]|uniref:ATP-binding protein n=1 Tax=Aquisphaera insulae TaxID=2712864 RepID=UPI0013EB98A9|nr:ATP-binding protein [Aquisphaera insulae]